jgi:rod shape-determining protein MreD
MARGTPLGNAAASASFVALCLGLVLLAVLPLDRLPGTLPGPDLLLATTLVWVIRRPDAVPVSVITIVFLLADIFWMRPPGLMTAAVVLGTEFLRRRSELTTEVSFVAEWGVASAIAASIVIGQSAVLVLFGVAPRITT